MSELQHYYSEYACGNAWADPDIAQCGCGGRGWWSSQVDTWHKCPYHHKVGQRHPEDDDCDMSDEAAPAVSYIATVAPTVYEDDDIPF